MRMRTKNVIIVLLAVLGLVALAMVEGVIKPNIQKQQQQYEVAQLNPSTNDFKNIQKFQSDYMGNAANLANLNFNLPLADVARTYSLNPDTRDVTIHYKTSAAKIGESHLQASLVYDATANFALIKNLASITFHFTDATYHVTRRQVQAWYEADPATLAADGVWHKKVQEKLDDDAYVAQAFNTLFRG